jgi:hypothetical protein
MVGGRTASHDELISVTQKNASGNALGANPTTFTWQGSGPMPSVDAESIGIGQWATTGGGGVPITVSGDFYGDGITDFSVPLPYPPGATCPILERLGRDLIAPVYRLSSQLVSAGEYGGAIA